MSLILCCDFRLFRNSRIDAIDFQQLSMKKFTNFKKQKEVYAVAVSDYSGADGFKFCKEERFILESEANNASWLVRRVESRDQFYAPSCHLAKESDKDHFEWISFDISKEDVDAILMDSKFAPGSFIIRPRQTDSVSRLMALCVKTKNTRNPIARFLIRREEDGFRIDSGRQTFETLTQLVENYADRRNTSNIVLTFSVKKDELVTKWVYDEKVIEKGRSLDSGSFGEVFVGKLYAEVVAIKVPNLDRMNEEQFMKEAEISRPCKHPNVLETIGFCMSPLYLITEYMKNGNLLKYMRKNKLSTIECLSISRKIADAMKYMSSIPIVHRDLAARNILVGETIDTIKVADFGLARSLQNSDYYFANTDCFPIRWTAPEGFVLFEYGIVQVQQGRITCAADVWSFGVVLWELYSNGQDPYIDVAADQLHTKLTRDGWRLQRPAKCPPEIYDKMLECWNLEKRERPTFTHLHEFLLDQPEVEVEVDDVHSDTDDDMVEVEIPDNVDIYGVETTR